MLNEWLRRVARVRAQLGCCVGVYANPMRSGGQSLLGEGYAERASLGDRSILHEFLTTAIEQLVQIREEVELAMARGIEPTTHLPGTEAKVELLRERAARGDQLFLDADGLIGDGSPAK